MYFFNSLSFILFYFYFIFYSFFYFIPLFIGLPKRVVATQISDYKKQKMASITDSAPAVEASEDILLATPSPKNLKVVYVKYVKTPKAGKKARTGSTEHVLESRRPHSKLSPQFHFRIAFFAFTAKRQSKIKRSDS